MLQFEHITTNPKILGGKPIIKDTRISVEFILELLASGAAVKDIVEAYPHLSEEAVKEVIVFTSTSFFQSDGNFGSSHNFSKNDWMALRNSKLSLLSETKTS